MQLVETSICLFFIVLSIILVLKVKGKFPASSTIIFSTIHQNSVTFVVSRSCHESFFERLLGNGLWLGERPRSRHNTQHSIKAVTINNKTPTKIMISETELESAMGNNDVPCSACLYFVVN